MLHIICALQCEAEPLIHRFQLKFNREHSLFPIYSNGEITLTISGIGKIHAAAATSYLAASFPLPKYSSWINIGIAGAKNSPIGNAFLADTLLDLHTHKRFYPGVSILKGFHTTTITTLDHPEETYRENTLVEMEATGFFSIASKLSPIELVHVLKVVSDNEHSGKEQINKQNVHKLIEEQLETVNTLASQLLQKTKALNTPYEILSQKERFLSHAHFTKTEQCLLEKALLRWNARFPGQNPWNDTFETLKTGKELLKELESKIQTPPLIF